MRNVSQLTQRLDHSIPDPRRKDTVHEQEIFNQALVAFLAKRKKPVQD